MFHIFKSKPRNLGLTSIFVLRFRLDFGKRVLLWKIQQNFFKILVWLFLLHAILHGTINICFRAPDNPISCPWSLSIALKISENKRFSDFSGDTYCVKNVQIQSFFWSVFSRIPSEYRKIWTRKNSVFRHFWHSERDQWHEVGSRQPSLIFFFIISNLVTYHIETRLLIPQANQWTGFYMIVTSVMNE